MIGIVPATLVGDGDIAIRSRVLVAEFRVHIGEHLSSCGPPALLIA